MLGHIQFYVFAWCTRSQSLHFGLHQNNNEQEWHSQQQASLKWNQYKSKNDWENPPWGHPKLQFNQVFFTVYLHRRKLFNLLWINLVVSDCICVMWLGSGQISTVKIWSILCNLRVFTSVAAVTFPKIHSKIVQIIRKYICNILKLIKWKLKNVQETLKPRE